MIKKNCFGAQQFRQQSQKTQHREEILITESLKKSPPRRAGMLGIFLL